MPIPPTPDEVHVAHATAEHQTASRNAGERERGGSMDPA